MKILWLKTELLHPVDKGGKIRTYQMLRELKNDHTITYLTLDDGSADSDASEKAAEYADEVITIPHSVAPKLSARFYAELAANVFSRLPYFMAKYRSRAMEERLVSLADEGEFDVLVCDFLMPSINVPKTFALPSILFQHNVEAMIWKRHFDVAKGTVKKAYMKRQWERTYAYEKAACERFDTVAAVSPEDAAFFRDEYGTENVFDIPTGVDLDYFTPRNGAERPPANIVFTGSMDWLPNQDAIEWFTSEVLPIIRRSIPEASMTVVGRDPFPALVDLASRDPLINVTGRVEDVRPYMQQASVYAVPIRIGGGTRLKLYEAMAMELPIVSTTIGAEGLPLEDGKELLLRDSPPDFADAIVKLIRDPDSARSLGTRAGERVRRDFGWKRVGDRFTEILKETVRRTKDGSRTRR